MHLNRNLFGALAVCAALSAPLASLAAVTVVTTEAAFDVLVGIKAPPDAFTVGSIPSPDSRTVVPFAYTATAANGLFAPSVGRLSTDTASDSLTLSAFSSNVRGFGAYFSVADLLNVNFSFAGELTFTYTVGLDVTTHTEVFPANSVGSRFVGFVFSSPILGQINITSSQLEIGEAAFMAVDNLTLASAVPELGTFPLIAFGAAALFAASLRRKRGA